MQFMQKHQNQNQQLLIDIDFIFWIHQVISCELKMTSGSISHLKYFLKWDIFSSRVFSINFDQSKAFGKLDTER